jgi:hypothetical protein
LVREAWVGPVLGFLLAGVFTKTKLYCQAQKKKTVTFCVRSNPPTASPFTFAIEQ